MGSAPLAGRPAEIAARTGSARAGFERSADSALVKAVSTSDSGSASASESDGSGSDSNSDSDSRSDSDSASNGSDSHSDSGADSAANAAAPDSDTEAGSSRAAAGKSESESEAAELAESDTESEPESETEAVGDTPADAGLAEGDAAAQGDAESSPDGKEMAEKSDKSAADSESDSAKDAAEDSEDAGPESPKAKSAAAEAAQAGLIAPSGLQIVVSSSVQAGLQIDETTHHAQASLSIAANYKLHDKIFMSARLTPYVELTKMPNDNRRTGLSPNGNSIRFNFRNLYTEKFSGISLGGNLGYVLPIGYNDLFLGNPRAGVVNGGLQLFRTIGPVVLVGSFGVNVPLFINQRAKLQCDPEEVKKVGASCPAHPYGNSYNTAVGISGSLLAIYSVGAFSFSASLQGGTSWTWGPGSANEPFNTNDHANQRFSQGFSFQGAYAINRSWSVNAGLFNGGPQFTGEWGRRNPFFNKDFAAVYAGVDWIY